MFDSKIPLHFHTFYLAFDHASEIQSGFSTRKVVSFQIMQVSGTYIGVAASPTQVRQAHKHTSRHCIRFYPCADHRSPQQAMRASDSTCAFCLDQSAQSPATCTGFPLHVKSWRSCYTPCSCTFFIAAAYLPGASAAAAAGRHLRSGAGRRRPDAAAENLFFVWQCSAR